MSKTPEQVAQDAVFGWDAITPTLAGRIVSALREAGWLRLSPMDLDATQQVKALTIQRNDALDAIAKLERDLAAARQERDQYKKLSLMGQGLLVETERLFHKDIAALRATQMTPAVQRVVEIATRKARALHPISRATRSDLDNMLIAAVDALTPQPVKAQEKRPWWTTERYMDSWCVRCGDKMHGPFSPEVCHALAIALNAEAK